jgi:peptide deformylase
MSVRTILAYPAPELRIKATAVTKFDAALNGLVDDLFDTLYASTGIGLAANQIGSTQRVVVIDVSTARDTPEHFVNPEIITRSQLGIAEESCLSLPGIVDKVERHVQLKVSALDRHGQLSVRTFEGLMAVALQHEIDHLDGKLFIDRLGFFDRWRVKKHLKHALMSST